MYLYIAYRHHETILLFRSRLSNLGVMTRESLA